MALDQDTLFNTTTEQASTAFGDVRASIKDETLPEQERIAATFIDLEAGLHASLPVYTAQSAAIVRRMQMQATLGVIIAGTALPLIAIQAAMNAIQGGFKELVNGSRNVSLVP